MFFELFERTWIRGLSRGYMLCPASSRSLYVRINTYKVRPTCVSRARVTALQTSRRYFSRYFGNRVAKDDSSVKVPALLSSGLKGSTFH
jgi:hypothetical protein